MARALLLLDVMRSTPLLLSVALGLLAGCGEGPPTYDPPDAPEPQVFHGCTYAEGPYGVIVNQTLPPEQGWYGAPPDGGEPMLLGVPDLFDCDGTRNIDAIVFHSAAYDCGPCWSEAAHLDQQIAIFTAKNQRVVPVVLLVRGADGEYAFNEDAVAWHEELGLGHSYVLADPSGTLMQGSDLYPRVTVVDPRTMRVEAVFNGAGQADGAIAALAERNAL